MSFAYSGDYLSSLRPFALGGLGARSLYLPANDAKLPSEDRAPGQIVHEFPPDNSPKSHGTILLTTRSVCASLEPIVCQSFFLNPMNRNYAIPPRGER